MSNIHNPTAYAAAIKNRILSAQIDKFTLANSELVGFIFANSNWSDFYSDMVDYLYKKGTLTDNQISAIEKGMIKAKEKEDKREKHSDFRIFSNVIAYKFSDGWYKTDYKTQRVAKAKQAICDNAEKDSQTIKL